MRFGDIVALVLLVAVVLGAVYAFNQRAEYQLDKEVWLQDKADLDLIIETAEERAKEEERKALEALAKADVVAEEKAEILELLRVERIAHERVLDNIKTLTPDQIVIAHHFHLEVDSTQVWLNSFGVQFTIEAARINLTQLEGYQFYLKTEIPRYESALTKQGEEVKELRLSNVGFHNTNTQLYIEIDALKLEVVGETKLRLKAERLVGFDLFSTKAVLMFLGGVVLGGLAVGVF